ncbi:hypothetical protein a10_01044 [Streptomyces acidiscabies]|nr:hypothetical protein a10_01044 [Streptomyces acidiscabies]GAV38362.1 hypothetical protein Saa2_01242 [Streptomyces acidiscabies]
MKAGCFAGQCAAMARTILIEVRSAPGVVFRHPGVH